MINELIEYIKLILEETIGYMWLGFKIWCIPASLAIIVNLLVIII